MPEEPKKKRAFVFVDGQNLYHAAKRAFGDAYPYSHPTYDVRALAEHVCSKRKWKLEQILYL